jgi:hypothetical protein
MKFALNFVHVHGMDESDHNEANILQKKLSQFSQIQQNLLGLYSMK